MLIDDPWDRKLLFENWLYSREGILNAANDSDIRKLLHVAFDAGYSTAHLSEARQKMIINSEKKIQVTDVF